MSSRRCCSGCGRAYRVETRARRWRRRSSLAGLRCRSSIRRRSGRRTSNIRCCTISTSSGSASCSPISARRWPSGSRRVRPVWPPRSVGWGWRCASPFRERQNPQATTEALRLPGVYFGLAAVFVSTFAPRSGFRAFCARPWISLVGGACYSIYLVHLQVTQVIAGFAAKAAPGAPLAAVAAIFVASALIVVAVGLTYYVLLERRFMTRDWHLLVWAAIKNALGVRSSAAPAKRLELAVSQPAAAKTQRQAEAPPRRAGAGRR